MGKRHIVFMSGSSNTTSRASRAQVTARLRHKARTSKGVRDVVRHAQARHLGGDVVQPPRRQGLLPRLRVWPRQALLLCGAQPRQGTSEHDDNLTHACDRWSSADRSQAQRSAACCEALFTGA